MALTSVTIPAVLALCCMITLGEAQLTDDRKLLIIDFGITIIIANYYLLYRMF